MILLQHHVFNYHGNATMSKVKVNCLHWILNKKFYWSIISESFFCVACDVIDNWYTIVIALYGWLRCSRKRIKIV